MTMKSNEDSSSGEKSTRIRLDESSAAPSLPIRNINDTVEKAMGAQGGPVPVNTLSSQSGSADSPKNNNTTADSPKNSDSGSDNSEN